jgi:hypothetical protein
MELFATWEKCFFSFICSFHFAFFSRFTVYTPKSGSKSSFFFLTKYHFVRSAKKKCDKFKMRCERQIGIRIEGAIAQIRKGKKKRFSAFFRNYHRWWIVSREVNTLYH